MATEKQSSSNLLKIEAEHAVKEVAYAVKTVTISKTLPATDERVYMNLLTKEQKPFCVELTVSGYRIVSEEFDKIGENLASRRYYETIYQLLDSASPDYRNSFGNALMTKLTELAKEREKEGTS